MTNETVTQSIIDHFSAHEANLSSLCRKTEDHDGLNRLVLEACKSFQSLFEILVLTLAERQALVQDIERLKEPKLMSKADRQKPALFMTPEEMTGELEFPAHIYASGCKCRTCSFQSSKWATLDLI